MRHAIAIGIEDTAGGYAPLPGAVAGAKRFSSWAESEGYVVDPFIDAEQGAITSSQILLAIDAIVTAGTCESLLVYFAGHGLAPNALGNIWLLSSGDTGPSDTDAVEVSVSRVAARSSGIDHVAFIGDACRSGSTSPTGIRIRGSSIFPLSGRPATSPVDLFLATQLGKTAAEIPADPSLNVDAHGVFSEVLIDVLEGENRDGTVTNPTTARDDVTARSLRKHLMKVVPRIALAKGAVRQDPYCLPESDWTYSSFDAVATQPLVIQMTVAAPASPQDATVEIQRYVPADDKFVPHGPGELDPHEHSLPSGMNYRVAATLDGHHQQPDLDGTAWLHRSPATLALVLEPEADRAGGGSQVVAPTSIRRQVIWPDGSAHEHAPANGIYEVVATDLLTGESVWATEHLGAGEVPTKPVIAADSAAEARLEELSQRSGRDHFETGQGLSILNLDIQVAHGPHDGLFPEDGAMHVRRSTEGSVLLEANERIIAAASFRDFIGTLTFDPLYGSVSQTTYWPAYDSMPLELRRRHVLAHSAAEQGRFEPAIKLFDDEIAPGHAPPDPGMAILAAYGHFLNGNDQAIDNIVSVFTNQGRSLPYDLMVFGRFDQASLQALGTNVVPSFPLLTATWDLLPGAAPYSVFDARSGLLDSLWTVFGSGTVNALINDVNSGVLP